MLTSDVGRIIFVVNCFGTFSQADENKIVETVRGRIGKYVMEKAKKVMGEDSLEFAVYKRKIGTPRVIGVYAKQALNAKETGDKEALEKSNFPEFEKALETMLTKERGVIALQILANKITNSGTEILRSVVMQENALMMANDEFMEKYDEAIKEIGEIRNKKRQEFVKINDAANQVFNDLQPVLDSYWTNIEQTAMEVIDNFQMSSDDFKKDQLKLVTAKLTEKIKESIEARAQIICEQIQNSINFAVSCEAERLQEFEDEFFESVTKIQQMFTISDRVSKNGGVMDNRRCYRLLRRRRIVPGLQRVWRKGRTFGRSNRLCRILCYLLYCYILCRFLWHHRYPASDPLPYGSCRHCRYFYFKLCR